MKSELFKSESNVFRNILVMQKSEIIKKYTVSFQITARTNNGKKRLTRSESKIASYLNFQITALTNNGIQVSPVNNTPVQKPIITPHQWFL